MSEIETGWYETTTGTLSRRFEPPVSEHLVYTSAPRSSNSRMTSR